MKIVLLGSGRVATQLGRALQKAGEEIIQIYSPTAAHATALAKALNTDFTSDLADLRTDADLYIISVKDDAIPALIQNLSLENKLLVHTSGSSPMALLEQASERIGVFYPLQTFSFEREVDFSTVPLLIESNDSELLKTLQNLGAKLSSKVLEADSKQRMVLHVAAVFACNFSNHLFAIAQQLLAKHQLDFELIRPLIAETALKVQSNLPTEVQTGPAIRKDELSIQKHLDLLKDQPQLQEIYRLLSQSIVNLR
ncbi:MAG: hypothetical protein RI924_861 [Bacteroidota bacterium]|jgi:predicted short-subunit dehydrogenase-like oxidoreductase (DUF2520 family)